jgi:hypothetical protein
MEGERGKEADKFGWGFEGTLESKKERVIDPALSPNNRRQT